MALEFFTVTGTLNAVTVDYVDSGDVPDVRPISATVTFIPRIPRGELLWASGLTPPQGIALPKIQARFDVDGVLRTIQNSAVNESQTITISGSPTGSFPLTYSGQTATIPFGSTPAAVATLLRALPTIGAGNVNVSGNNTGPYQVTFTGALAATNVPTLTTTHPNVAITTTKTGTLGAGVQLTANTAAIDRDELIYDVVLTNVNIPKASDADDYISPFGFIAPTIGGTILDMSQMVRIPPLPGL